MVTDKQRMAAWRRIKDPVKMLETMIENSSYIGSDPYYRDLNDALWKQAEKVVEEARKGRPPWLRK